MTVFLFSFFLLFVWLVIKMEFCFLRSTGCSGQEDTLLGLHSLFINMKRTSKNSGKVAHPIHPIQSIDTDVCGHHYLSDNCKLLFEVLYSLSWHVWLKFHVHRRHFQFFLSFLSIIIIILFGLHWLDIVSVISYLFGILVNILFVYGQKWRTSQFAFVGNL